MNIILLILAALVLVALLFITLVQSYRLADMQRESGAAKGQLFPMQLQRDELRAHVTTLLDYALDADDEIIWLDAQVSDRDRWIEQLTTPEPVYAVLNNDAPAPVAAGSDGELPAKPARKRGKVIEARKEPS